MAVRPYTGHDDKFIMACSKAGIPATARQYRKYMRKQGKAYKLKHKD